MSQAETQVPQNGEDWPSPTEDDLFEEIQEITYILFEKAEDYLSKASSHNLQIQATALFQAIEKVLSLVQDSQPSP